MQQQINRQIVLVKRPAGTPDESCFKLVTSSMPLLANEQVLVRTRFISVDPYMRGRMNDRVSFVAPFSHDLHEAVAMAEREDQESGIVVDELRRGYLWNNELLRPAQVRVAG